jgi:hypothetical protein
VQILSTRFECDTHRLGCLTKLCQTSTIMEYITAFEQLAILTEGQSDLFFKECFMNGLKDAIKAHVMMQCPQTWFEACDKFREAKIVINAQFKRHLFNTHPNPRWKLLPTPLAHH